MVVRGHFQNGVVVLDESVLLAEGQKVAVLTLDVHPGMAAAATKARSVLDIPAVSLGRVLRLAEDDADLLGEMLECRS
jgi:hypothetical protein